MARLLRCQIAKQEIKKAKPSFFNLLLAINNMVKSQCLLGRARISPATLSLLRAVKYLATKPTKNTKGFVSRKLLLTLKLKFFVPFVGLVAT
ncbi:MAG: hypothetical protein A2505_07845 [Deltaproteobacteria bacterium RIFOXYD12_FULL_55_16]|nr:MAG: hypothetical protein A2505_07845 [Deltaproteobacteria bacterium RIFOXYD12_FULL_55_16]